MSSLISTNAFFLFFSFAAHVLEETDNCTLQSSDSVVVSTITAVHNGEANRKK